MTVQCSIIWTVISLTTDIKLKQIPRQMKYEKSEQISENMCTGLNQCLFIQLKTWIVLLLNTPSLKHPNVGMPNRVHFLPSVHCAPLLHVQGASQNIVSADTVGAPGKLKVIHLVITWSVIQCYVECYRSFFLLCSALCFYGPCEIQYGTKNFHLWLPCEKRHT
jgi:hypothetical protein